MPDVPDPALAQGVSSVSNWPVFSSAFQRRDSTEAVGPDFSSLTVDLFVKLCVLDPSGTLASERDRRIADFLRTEVQVRSKGLGQAIGEFSPEDREYLSQRFGKKFFKIFLSLSEERDPEMFYRGLLEFARVLRDGFPGKGGEILLALAENSGRGVPQGIQNIARDELEGKGGLGWEYWLGRFAKEIADVRPLLSVLLAGFAGRMVKEFSTLKVISRRLGVPIRYLHNLPQVTTFAEYEKYGILFSKNIQRGIALGAFGAEVTTFTLAQRIQAPLSGHNSSWSAGDLWHSWWISGAALGAWRLAGAFNRRFMTPFSVEPGHELYTKFLNYTNTGFRIFIQNFALVVGVHAGLKINGVGSLEEEFYFSNSGSFFALTMGAHLAAGTYLGEKLFYRAAPRLFAIFK